MLFKIDDVVDDDLLDDAVRVGVSVKVVVDDDDEHDDAHLRGVCKVNVVLEFVDDDAFVGVGVIDCVNVPFEVAGDADNGIDDGDAKGSAVMHASVGVGMM